MNDQNHSNDMSRREFLKIVGISTATTTAVLAGCGPKDSATSSLQAEGEIPTDKMTLRENPKTKEKVSLLGYGCMRWPTLPAPEKGGNVIDQDAVNELIDYAMAHGVNYYDTSPVYVQGWSERSTGIALKRHPREKFFVATKLSNFSNRYIENGMIDFLMKEREAGRIRNLGFSFHGTQDVFDEVLAMHDQVHWDFVQIQLNYVDWKYASGRNVNADYLYAELEKRHIPAIIMEPLLGGRLSKLPEHLVARLKQRGPEASVASWAFRFAGTFPDVLTVLSGMTYMEHLQDNLRTYSPLVPLTDDDLEFLQQTADLMKQYPTIPCNDCKYCMPCPYGIDIPAVLIHYNKCVNEGNLPTSQEHANYREARRAFLIGYDRSVPRLRQASHCRYVEQLKQETL